MKQAKETFYIASINKMRWKLAKLPESNKKAQKIKV